MDLLAGAKRRADRLPERWRPWLVGALALVSVSLVQWFAVFDQVPLFDGKSWVSEVGQASEWDFPAQGDYLYGYPGMTVLLPGAALVHALGVSAEQALRMTMAASVALLGAIAALLAYWYNPRSYWWLFVLWLYTFQSQFSLATPPSGLLVALLPVLVLLVLFAARGRPRIPLLAGIGVVVGVMLATRLDSAIPVLGVMTLYLATKRFAALYVIPLAAVNTFLLLDPSLYIESPVAHIAGILEKVLFLADTSVHGKANAFEMMYAAGKFGLLALLLGVLLLLIRKLRSLPAGFLAVLTGMTLAFLAGLSLVKHHPSWMYAPFLMVFQMFLPLLALDAYEALPENGSIKRLRPPGSFLRVLALVYLGLTALAFWVEVAWL